MVELFNTFLVNPITNVLVAIYTLLTAIHVPFALGFSIILLTVLIRFILYPLTASQLRASRKMQIVAPHLSQLRKKHKGDSARLQKETMLLYKEHGVNPAAGCLPVLIQLPIIWALYGTLRHVVTLPGKAVVDMVNNIVYFPFLRLTHPWDAHFFGLPLGKNPSQLISVFGFLILLLPLLTGLLQFVQSKMMFPVKDKKIVEKKEKKEGSEDFSSIMQTQTIFLFPVMIAFFSYSFPIGLSLYWNTFTIFGIIQQYKVQGFGGLSDLKKYLPKNK